MELIKGFRAVGMSVPNRPPAALMGNPQSNMETVVQQSIQKARNEFGIPPDVILVLLEAPTIPLYRAIKNALDVREGVASQIMAGEKALKCQPQYIANIALKVCYYSNSFIAR